MSQVQSRLTLASVSLRDPCVPFPCTPEASNRPLSFPTDPSPLHLNIPYPYNMLFPFLTLIMNYPHISSVHTGSVPCLQCTVMSPPTKILSPPFDTSFSPISLRYSHPRTNPSLFIHNIQSCRLQIAVYPRHTLVQRYSSCENKLVRMCKQLTRAHVPCS